MPPFNGCLLAHQTFANERATLTGPQSIGAAPRSTVTTGVNLSQPRLCTTMRFRDAKFVVRPGQRRLPVGSRHLPEECGPGGPPRRQTAHSVDLSAVDDTWCAISPTFEDLQRSPAGFGNAQQEAIEAMRAELRKAGYPDHAIPKVGDFKVHGD
jgi:hypothetical protein